MNVIVHNLPECDDSDPSNRKSHDISKISSIVDKYLSVPTTVTQAIRIGKREKRLDYSKSLSVPLKKKLLFFAAVLSLGNQIPLKDVKKSISHQISHLKNRN